MANDDLLGFISGLKSDDVSFWSDEKLITGDNWDEEIKDKIKRTHIALVLVSQWFLDSDYCNTEISNFLLGCRERGLIIFPIILSACDWSKHEWLKSRQYLPGGDQTIEEHYNNPGPRKRLFLQIRQDLEKQIKMIINQTDQMKKEEGPKTKEYEIFISYLNSALEKHRHLPTQGFETKVRIAIELERIYINMRAVIQSCEFEFTVEARSRMREKIREEKLSALDLKATFAASRKYNIKDIVILGDPGSGKTTLLKYILIMLIQGRGEEKIGIDTHLIPFFAPLRELKDPEREEFLDFIKRVCRLDKFAIQEKDLHAVLESGRSIILLDGLDEVADERTRIKICQWIDEARIRFAKTRFVITSRFAGYLGKSRLEGNCLELSIQDFTEQEVKAFLIRWFESVETIIHAGEDDTLWKERGREEALTLFKRISESEHIRKLAVTPLLLQIIALVHRDRGTLPQRRVELYEECTNVLLEKWDMAKGLNSLISAREARQVLQPLALWLHAEDERRSAPLKQIIEVIEEPLQEIGKSGIDMKKLLLNIRDRSGIFMGYSETEYGFTHLSF